jgi:hypothetical protein
MKHWAMQSHVLFAASLSLCSVHVWAQDAYLSRWQALHGRQPNGVTFEISAAKNQFYSGELIPLQLSFTSAQANGFVADSRLQDRAGRMNGMEEFLVDPVALTEDPLHGLPGENIGMGGLSGGPVPLSAKPFTFERFLNEWVRFRKPGKYRVAVLSRRVSHISDPAAGRLELVSNILAIEIVPAPAAWVKEQIAEAVTTLDGPLNDDLRERRLRASATLRFLESPEAALELVRHLGSGDDIDSWAMHMGVLGSAYRRQLLPVMEARLTAPDQPVWDRYLDTLSRLSQLVSPGGPARNEYAARLVASLPSKQIEARVISMNTLVDSANRDGRSDTTWLRPVAASIVADFRSLPPRMQSDLLVSRWNIIGGPAMLPVLREIYAQPLEPHVDQLLREMAVRRIYDLAPEEGRKIILSDIARPDPYLSFSTLSMLPDRHLPELNDVLVARLNSGQVEDILILRYATGDIVQRVEQAYVKRNAEFDRQKLIHCGGPLIYYFLRYDPAFGEKELRRDLDQPGGPPACYDIGFQFNSLDQNAYSPALERVAIDLLTSPKVPVKRGAAEVLGKYGSPAAQKPLWDTLDYFHSWWKGREGELDQQNGQEGLQFERTLRLALAQADAWTLDVDALHRLLDLCSSDWCRQEVTDWLAAAKQPIQIDFLPVSDEVHTMIARYETRSEEQMRRKLAQFPAGTVFRVAHYPNSDVRLRAEVDRAEQIVRSAGFSLAPQ